MDIFTMILMTLYGFVCCIWGIYSVEMQIKVYPNAQGLWRQYGVFVVNFLFCPIAVTVAAIKLCKSNIEQLGSLKKNSINEK